MKCPPKPLYTTSCYHFKMETDTNHQDLEACLRTFRKLAYKIDEMNTKLTHIIERLREQHVQRLFEEPMDRDRRFFEAYEKHDQLDEDND